LEPTARKRIFDSGEKRQVSCLESSAPTRHRFGLTAEGGSLREEKIAVQQDHLIQATAADATVRALAVVATNLVDEACRRHGTSPTASAALGRTLAGALMLGRTFKDLERITLQFRCDGALGGITAEASAHGTVRGYVRHPAADLPLNERGKLDVRGIVGGGTLYVIREAGVEIGLAKEPYRGAVPLVSGEIAEDLAYYLTVSEQINSAISLGVFIEPEQGRVSAAGGFLIQLMPGAEAETIAALEASIARAPQASALIRGGADAEALLQTVLGEIPFEVLDQRPVEFRCTCSYDRAAHIVSCLGREEVEDMLVKDKGAELTCHFCSAVYWLDEAALEKILAPPALM
jgi:molecular chaperone Hsp33